MTARKQVNVMLHGKIQSGPVISWNQSPSSLEAAWDSAGCGRLCAAEGRFKLRSRWCRWKHMKLRFKQMKKPWNSEEEEQNTVEHTPDPNTHHSQKTILSEILFDGVNLNLQVYTCHLSMSSHPMLWTKGPKAVADAASFQQRCRLISNIFITLGLGLSLMHNNRDLLYCREGPLGSFWRGRSRPAQRTNQSPLSQTACNACCHSWTRTIINQSCACAHLWRTNPPGAKPESVDMSSYAWRRKEITIGFHLYLISQSVIYIHVCSALCRIAVTWIWACPY